MGWLTDMYKMLGYGAVSTVGDIIKTKMAKEASFKSDILKNLLTGMTAAPPGPEHELVQQKIKEMTGVSLPLMSATYQRPETPVEVEGRAGTIIGGGVAPPGLLEKYQPQPVTETGQRIAGLGPHGLDTLLTKLGVQEKLPFADVMGAKTGMDKSLLPYVQMTQAQAAANQIATAKLLQGEKQFGVTEAGKEKRHETTTQALKDWRDTVEGQKITGQIMDWYKLRDQAQKLGQFDKVREYKTKINEMLEKYPQTGFSIETEEHDTRSWYNPKKHMFGLADRPGDVITRPVVTEQRVWADFQKKKAEIGEQEAVKRVMQLYPDYLQKWATQGKVKIPR